MQDFKDVVWCTEPPRWEDMPAFPHPVFLAPPIRLHLRVALLRAAVRPVASVRALALGANLRELLAFYVFLDTVRGLGIQRISSSAGAPSPLDGLLRRSRAARAPRRDGAIGCVLIAQDEEDRIAKTLSSVQPFVDEIVVVDGGSKDATMEIARDFEAKIIERPFDKDFAAQRNAGLEHVRCPWTLVIDADEVLEADLGRLLVDLVSITDADAIHVPFLNFIDEHGDVPVFWPDVHPRVFRTGFRYELRVHCEIVNYRRSVFTPLSGPFILHRKSLLQQHRASLLYSTIDPTPYTAEYLEQIRAEVRRLEEAGNASAEPS